MKNHIRIASTLLAITMASQIFTPIGARAVELNQVENNNSQASAVVTNEVSSINIVGIDEPKPGEVLPMSARAIADNGATWKIPVVWVDADGNICKIASNNIKAYPVFALYIPKEYKLKVNVKGGIKVNLPEYINNLFGGEELLFIDDPATGINFITGINGAGKNLTAERVANVDSFIRQTAQAARNEELNVQSDAQTQAQTQAQVQPSESKKDTSDNNQPKEEPGVDLVAMHCDKKAVETMGYDKLAALTELVRYTVQPQAVNLLVESFPAFTQAVADNALGKETGLYIYYNDALMLNYNENTQAFSDIKYENMKNALAYVSAVHYPDSYETVIDEKTGEEKERAIYKGNIKYVVAVNASSVEDSFYQDDDGLWKLKTDKSIELGSVIVHEMMHGFMFDYTRPGMTGYVYYDKEKEVDSYYANKVSYPNWFEEGIATCVENAYQYWGANFKEYYGYYAGDENGNTKGYSLDDLVANYQNSEYKMQLKYCKDETDNTLSAYCSGYLACLYLAELVTENEEYREKYGIEGHARYDEIGEDGKSYYVMNNEIYKTGLDIILREMHGYLDEEDETQWICSNLSQIITKVSPKDENGESIYKSADDFTDKFITGDEASAKFCVATLDYLEHFSDENGTVSGSVLRPFDSTDGAILQGESVDGKAYVIRDNTSGAPVDYVTSTVDPYMAYLPYGKDAAVKKEDTESEQEQEEVTGVGPEQEESTESEQEQEETITQTETPEEEVEDPAA